MAEKHKEEKTIHRSSERRLAPRRDMLPSLLSLSPREFLNMSPFEMMRRFGEQVDRVFEGGGATRRGGDQRGLQLWSPAIEVFERDNDLVVRAELPGIRKEDVKIEMTDDSLVIEGDRKEEYEETRENVYRSERSYGHFYREIPLPEGIEEDQVHAHFSDGMLEVTMPMPRQERKRREIKVTGGSQ